MAHHRPHAVPDPGLAVEAEVRGNVLAQRIGVGTVADLNFPSDFVSRVADRVIRKSFYERHRAVTDPSAPVAAASPPAQPSEGPTAVSPALASFRSPETIGENLAKQLLLDPLPPDAHPHREIEPRRIVRQRLAREGLLPTLARVILHLGPAKFVDATERHVEELTRFGLPLDLLAWFSIEGVRPSPAENVSYIAKELVQGVRIEKLEKSLRRAQFHPVPSLPGFRPTSENGLDMPHLLRAQVTRDTHYAAAGDGGCLDLVGNVIHAVPGRDVFLTVHASHAAGVGSFLRDAANDRSLTIRPQPMPVSQWGGDNAKAGSIPSGSSSHGTDRTPAHLTPRFAARREEATQYLLGDDHAVAAAMIPGVVSRRSPLVFEGGNLLVCDDPGRGDRVLLIGEAEIYRNQALGLSRDQAFEAFRAEFGCQRAVVLSAASYHIDQEVTVRALSDGKLIAFLPDVQRGVRMIIEVCLSRLRDAGRWPVDLISQALEFLHDGRPRETLTLVWEGLSSERLPDGSWPVAFAEVFSTGPADSGVGNLHRFLLALDHLAGESSDPSEFTGGHFRSLLRSFTRREQDRRSLRARIEGLGWKVALVPALPEDSRGVNPLNAIQLRGCVLMPIYGGLFAHLDATAKNALAAAIPDSAVSVLEVPSGESQRREGAVHCSWSVFGW